MAHWTDRLERVKHPDGRILIGASFRGISFFVESSDRSGGRRNAVHEFAQSDLPAYDDLGRKARGFTVSGYVLGSDYMVQRDALLGALEDTPGAGELVHPYYGIRRVRVGDVSVRESISDGGVAFFQISFLDAPVNTAPSVTRDLRSVAGDSAAAAFVANQSQFEESYSISGQPTFATESLQDDLAQLAGGLRDVLSPIAASSQELALINIGVQSVIDDAATLVKEPANVINALLDQATQLVDTIEESPNDMVSALLDAYDIPVIADVLGTTTTRDRERENQAALGDALRGALAIQAALVSLDAEFTTVEEARELRGRIVDALDALAGSAGDTSYPALVDLRSSIMAAIPGDAVLASVRTVRRSVATSSLALSHYLYGDVDQEQDISDRNNAQHPLFISGDIEVLSFG